MTNAVRIFLAVVPWAALVAWAGPAAAQNTAAQCIQVEDEQARLRCFDTAYRQQTTQPPAYQPAYTPYGTPYGQNPAPAPQAPRQPAYSPYQTYSAPAPAPGTYSAPVPPPVAATAYPPAAPYGTTQPSAREEAFGSFGYAVTASQKEINAIRMRIVRYGLSAYGKSVLYMSNGQVWRQTDSLRALRFNKDDAYADVVIRKAVFGSFKMTVAKLGRTIRVKRVK